MRIIRARFQNFRCLDDVEVFFDDVTTFIGPNGVGKSTVLRALDWYFNNGILTSDDVRSGAAVKKIVVEVEFGDLTETDREALGKYALPGVDTVTIWKAWEDGKEKQYGHGKACPDFAAFRNATSATERRAIYNNLRSDAKYQDLAAVSTDALRLEQLEVWEAAHVDQLDEVDMDTPPHFFGFAGQGVMSGLFDYVLVTADLRASEQTQDVKGAILGRILEQAIDRKGADTDLLVLAEKMQAEHARIQRKHFDDQLKQLSEEMTSSVASLATGREVCISAQEPTVQPQKAQFRVSVLDDDTETRVDRQGHGFQRALLLSALRLLAERGRSESEAGVICLAIEEPELFQHPLQARNFARVLRDLATDHSQGIQVAYATHSPFFIEARAFHQVRRVIRRGAGSRGSVEILGSTQEEVLSRVTSYVKKDVVKRQIDGVCMFCLGDALFAEKVLLVEGGTDRGAFSGCAERTKCLLEDGVSVTECGGKASVLLPYVVLEKLGIPALLVVDNDKHLEERLAAAQANGDDDHAKKLLTAIADAKAWNRKLLKFFGQEECDWPSGRAGSHLFFMDPNLDAVIEAEWPEWVSAKDELVKQGLGFEKKDSVTYQQTSVSACGDIPKAIDTVIDDIRGLVSTR